MVSPKMVRRVFNSAAKEGCVTREVLEYNCASSMSCNGSEL